MIGFVNMLHSAHDSPTTKGHAMDTAPMQPPTELSQGWFTTWEIAPGVICIAEGRHMEQVRSYLVRGSERWMLWDTGQGIGDMRAEVARFVPVAADTLVVVMSHSHTDHVGGVAAFADAGCDIYAHAAEADAIAAGVPHEDAVYWLQERFLTGALPPGFDPDAFALHPAAVTHFLTHGEVLDLGDRQFAVLHTPGHSPGGVALWDAAHRLLLSGDTVYAGPLYAYSRDDADPDAYRASTRALAALAPYIDTLLPSHNATPQGPGLLVAVADAFEAIATNHAQDAYIARDDEAGEDFPYDLYDYGAFQVRVRPGWGRG